MPSQQHVRWAEFRILVTVAAALLILGTLVYLLTGGTILRPQSPLYVYVPDGTGLAPGSPVRVDGFQVGKVAAVSLSGSAEPNRVVKVSMMVDRTQLPSITADSTAQPAADTMVGDKFIQISTGKSAERLEPGAEIQYKGSPDLIKSLDLSQFRQSLDQMDGIVTDIENGRGLVGQAFQSDTTYRDLLRRVSELESGIRTAVNTTSGVGREIYSDTLLRKLDEPIAQLDDALARLQSGQGSAGQFLRDNAQYEQAQQQIGALRKSIADVRASEFFTSTANYGQWERNVAAWIRQVDEFTASPAMASSFTYENLTGMARELAGTAREFRQDPRKFLRLKVF